MAAPPAMVPPVAEVGLSSNRDRVLPPRALAEGLSVVAGLLGGLSAAIEPRAGYLLSLFKHSAKKSIAGVIYLLA